MAKSKKPRTKAPTDQTEGNKAVISPRLWLYGFLALIVLGGAAMFLQPKTSTTAQNAVNVPQLQGVEVKGKQAFDANCASCHGPDASGTSKGPTLIHKYYEPSHHGDGAFYQAARRGVRQHHWNFGNMPRVKGVSDEQISAIVAYVRKVQRANGIQ